MLYTPSFVQDLVSCQNVDKEKPVLQGHLRESIPMWQVTLRRRLRNMGRQDTAEKTCEVSLHDRFYCTSSQDTQYVPSPSPFTTCFTVLVVKIQKCTITLSLHDRFYCTGSQDTKMYHHPLPSRQVLLYWQSRYKNVPSPSPFTTGFTVLVVKIQKCTITLSLHDRFYCTGSQDTKMYHHPLPSRQVLLYWQSRYKNVPSPSPFTTGFTVLVVKIQNCTITTSLLVMLVVTSYHVFKYKILGNNRILSAKFVYKYYFVNFFISLRCTSSRSSKNIFPMVRTSHPLGYIH